MMDQLKEQSHSHLGRSTIENLKVAIGSALILAIVDPHKLFVVEIDTSAKAMGVMLLQDVWSFSGF